MRNAAVYLHGRGRRSRRSYVPPHTPCGYLCIWSRTRNGWQPLPRVPPGRSPLRHPFPLPLPVGAYASPHAEMQKKGRRRKGEPPGKENGVEKEARSEGNGLWLRLERRLRWRYPPGGCRWLPTAATAVGALFSAAAGSGSPPVQCTLHAAAAAGIAGRLAHHRVLLLAMQSTAAVAVSVPPPLPPSVRDFPRAHAHTLSRSELA